MSRALPVVIAALAAQALIQAAAHTSDAAKQHPCAAIENAAARLACYDQAFGRPAAPADAELSAAAAEKARQEFGLTEVEKRARDPSSAPPEGPKSIEGIVRQISRHPTGDLVITLADGQVWRQAEPGVDVLLAEGDRVTVRRGALGSYLLVTPKRAALRVRRVQ